MQDFNYSAKPVTDFLTFQTLVDTLQNLSRATRAGLFKLCTRYWWLEVTSEWRLVNGQASMRRSLIKWLISDNLGWWHKLGQWHTVETFDNVLLLHCWSIHLHTLYMIFPGWCWNVQTVRHQCRSVSRTLLHWYQSVSTSSKHFC